jgi:dTDP-4-dehydrorhamnose reductase
VPADVIGVNHYVTSERFLDDRLKHYPPHTHGGNGQIAYADVEAVRVVDDAPLGFEGVLRETWARYGSKIAVTECHIGCTREEQLRWFTECWEDVTRLRAEGLDIEAVTVWALLGSHDWVCLLREENVCYENGVYDLRSGYPRPTAMVDLLKSLSAGEEPKSPALPGEGWWRRDIRLEYPATPAGVAKPAVVGRPRAGEGRPVLITGATGTLGQALPAPVTSAA